MKHIFFILYQRHKKAYTRKWFFLNLILAFAFWELSIRFMFTSGHYAESVPYTPSVHDLILDALPTIDMNWISTYGIEWAIKFTYIYALFALPSYLPFVLKTFAMFKVFRGFFISILHLGPPFGMIPDGFDNVFASNYLTKDLFFSGHTGYIFLSAFIFWNNKPMRYGFIAFAVFIGGTTIFMHDHYTIDFLAAFPITFTVYMISKTIFKSDWLIYRDPEYMPPKFLSLSPTKGNKPFEKNVI